MTRRAGEGQLDMFVTEAEPAVEPASADRFSGPTTVICLKGRQGDPLLDSDRFAYVGRPMYQGGWRLHGHLLANPFKVGKQVTQEQAVARYRHWLANRPAAVLVRELPKLKGKVLGCWCSEGSPCHARVLAEAADAYDEGGE